MTAITEVEWQIEDGHKLFTNEVLLLNGMVLIVPTSDPKIANAVWNNNGVLNISKGQAE
jgi:hypothetical protein